MHWLAGRCAWRESEIFIRQIRFKRCSSNPGARPDGNKKSNGMITCCLFKATRERRKQRTDRRCFVAHRVIDPACSSRIAQAGCKAQSAQSTKSNPCFWPRTAFIKAVCEHSRAACAHAPWHFLYFFPLPQGQGSLRSGFASRFNCVRGVSASMRCRCRSASIAGSSTMMPRRSS
jgi:hypothetical protein